MPNVRKPSIDKPFFGQNERSTADTNNHKSLKRFDIRLGLVIIWEVCRLSFGIIVYRIIYLQCNLFSVRY